MFRITFMTDERRIGKALKALIGLSAGLPEIQPMHGAALAEDGTVTAQPPINHAEFFGKFQKNFRTHEVMAELKKDNRPAHTSSTAKTINEAIKLKLIKRVGAGRYVRVSK
jgi:hypothetical protein